MNLKSKSIDQMTTQELMDLNSRLRLEKEVESMILNLRQQKGERWDYENPPIVDTKTPIGQLCSTHSEFVSKSISELTTTELYRFQRRLQNEEYSLRLISELKRNSGEKWDYENPPTIDTSEPVENLYHHGILGMKWGVRRYQNEDGSLTNAGQKRYKSLEKAAKETSKILGEAGKIGTGTKSKKLKKDYSDITDAELQKRVARLNLEENYGRLTGDTKMVRSGSEWVREILQDTAITVGVLGSALSIYLALKK